MYIWLCMTAFTFLVCEFVAENRKKPVTGSILCGIVWPIFWAIWLYFYIQEVKKEVTKRKQRKERRKQWIKDSGYD